MPGRPCAKAAALTALLLLAACDQGPATVTHYRHPSGGFEYLVSATRNQGPLHLQVAGSPFAGPGNLETEMIPVMEQALQSRPLRLTLDRSAAEDPRFRLLIVFNPAETGELLALCKTVAGGGPPKSQGRVELRAAFCRGEDLLVGLDGWAEEVAGPADPKFAQLLRQVTRDTFSRDRGDD